jgi:hypothetical protein
VRESLGTDSAGLQSDRRKPVGRKGGKMFQKFGEAEFRPSTQSLESDILPFY